MNLLRPESAAVPQAAQAPVDVAVLIVSWNTCGLLRACLRSMADAAPGLNVQVIVVDNGSSDGSPALVRDMFPGVLLAANAENVGFVAGNNQGYVLCDPGARYVLLLNADAELRPGALSRLVACMDARPRTGACGPLTLNADGTLQATWNRFPTLLTEMRGIHDRRFVGQRRAPRLDVDTIRSLPHPQPTDWVGGSCLLARRAAIDGDLSGVLLDPAFTMYSEETDLCYRLKKHGWDVFLVPGAECVHHGGQSSRQMPAQTLGLLYRSKILFFRRHYGRLRAAQLRAGLCLVSALKWAALIVLGNQDQRQRQWTVLRSVLRVNGGL